MIRHAAAVVVALVVTALPLAAQTTVFKVSSTSANVHKGPSTGSPVIGSAARGASLEVTRELGSWVKVVWAQAPDKVGYIHTSTGEIARASAAPQRRTMGSPTPTVAPPPPPPPAPPATTRVAYAERDAAPPPRGYIRPQAHVLGFGARVGGPDPSFGVAARAWSREQFGAQVEVSRLGRAIDPAGLTTLEVAPSVIYALHDRVYDYWWVRPYLGAGPTLLHRNFDGVVPNDSDPLSETRVGFQVFGGGEVTFASLPRVAFSADLGYRRRPTSFAGVDSGGVGLVVSGHWYWK